jgi:hypothetical protein
MKLFLSYAGNFPGKIGQNRKKKKSKNKKQNKSRHLHKDYNYVILMMAYAIHSNVRNLGLFFNYDKVGISK